MASRLSQSISKESAKLKDLIIGHNNLVAQNEQLKWLDVASLSSGVWVSGMLSTLNSDILVQIKLEAIKNHHLVLRADKEISLLHQDMFSTLQFYISNRNLLVDKINRLKDSENASGAICSLQCARIQTEIKIEESMSLFNSYIEVPPISTDEFLLHQINCLQQDNNSNDSTDTVEALGSNTEYLSNEDVNELEEDSEIGNIRVYLYLFTCLLLV